MRRVVIAIAGLGALAFAGCTSSSGSGAPSSVPGSTTYSTVTQTKSATTPSVSTPKPVGTGPTKAATASSCPLITTQTAALRVGMRLARITVLRAGGKVVGCRLYADQSPPFNQSEHLPGPEQPAIEITTTRYRTDLDAHNAFVLTARKGKQPQQVDIGISNLGVCFQTPFYVNDKGTDWACAFSVAKSAVVVKTVASLSSIARDVSIAVARKI